MATIRTNIARQFKDLDLNFTIHPLKKDINKNLDQVAVINAIKNLILTNHYEKPFNPDYGSNVRKLLFETVDIVTASAIEREIQQTIQNYEPRVNLISVSVIPNTDNNAFSVQMYFYIVNQTNPVTVSFLLERTR
jgi:phage baseplate assembly protein W